MLSTTVKHKIRIFISSRCGGKYTIARKALSEILLATGLTETYVFETEPGGSEDVISAYLSNVDDSSLCIFLIDNKDNVSTAVMSEIKRAKDLKIRQIYIFCNENEKNPTDIQKDLEIDMMCKYYISNKFSDLVKDAYDSVMQDIVNIYKNRQLMQKNNPIIEKDDATFDDSKHSVVNLSNEMTKEKNEESIHEQNRLIEPDLAKDIRISYRDFVKKNIQITNEDTLESKLKHFLFVCLNKLPFNKNEFEFLKDELLKLKKDNVKKLYELRYSAMCFYYLKDFDNCIDCLKKALLESTQNDVIPYWVSIDISIDLRNVFIEKDKSINILFNENNPGQLFLNDRKEPVYYPILDRYVSSANEKLIKLYMDYSMSSPYESRSGGIDEVLNDFVNAFCCATLNGSITQSLLTKERVADTFVILAELFDDHELYSELIRLLIVCVKSETLEKIMRTSSYDYINENDLKSIMNSVDNIPLEENKYKSYLLLLRFFGYSLDDIIFEKLSKFLYDFSNSWIDDAERIYFYNDYIFLAMKSNLERLDIKK